MGTFNRTTGGEIWAYDGTQWLQVLQENLPATGNQGCRSMIVFQGQLYAGTFNTVRPEVWRTPDGVHGSTDGLVDPFNSAMHSMAVSRKQLSIGTKNQDTMLQAWRTSDGDHYEQVVGPNAAVPPGLASRSTTRPCRCTSTTAGSISAPATSTRTAMQSTGSACIHP